MENIKKIIIFVLLLASVSCSLPNINGIEVKIENNNNYAVLVIFEYQKTEYENFSTIKHQEKISEEYTLPANKSGLYDVDWAIMYSVRKASEKTKPVQIIIKNKEDTAIVLHDQVYHKTFDESIEIILHSTED
ncbi:MAG: hypothetical protein MJB14_00865 [Spirochaetes bacterium]|nr:hypothetical protein [Spirochaetota bacterium]